MAKRKNPSNEAHFRFGDLPGEIRRKIYRILLCDFAPPPLTRVVEDDIASEVLRFVRATHSVETAILRTNTSIYREAYDVMIKSNRLVKITTAPGIPTRAAFSAAQIPVVCQHKEKVERFPGYVLAIDLSATISLRRSLAGGNPCLEPCTIMILHRDLDKFCFGLSDIDMHVPGLSRVFKLTITVAPILETTPRSRYSFSFVDYFTKKTQESLLAVPRKDIRGCKVVTINGHIDKALNKTICNEMKSDRWTDPKSLLEQFKAAKNDGSSLFRSRNNEAACLAWQDAATDIDKVHGSSSWPKLVKKGGQDFVSQVAELYFLLRINVAHIKLTAMQSLLCPSYEEIMASDALVSAMHSLGENYWITNYTYRPSDKHMAKFRYRYALYLRLQDSPEVDDPQLALSHINDALLLLPDDPVIVKEKANIVEWIAQTELYDW